MPSRRIILVGLLMASSLALALGVRAAPVDDSLYQAMEWRNIGPWRGGRVTAVTGVRGQPHTFYMGATGGGLWKTVNAGTSWENISDKDFNVGTIGAVAVSESDPNVIYAGTGESPIRGVTTSNGDGVYKSTDGGRTWSHTGLEKTRQIARIRIHPTNPDVVYVAAQGNPWGPNAERGVYKSTDGGKSWRLVLKGANPSTGAVDLSLDATNPRILYAALWDHGRKPWFMRSGGPGSGIYKSTDSGKTWEKLSGGLPKLTGKIGVAVSPADSDRIYAIVEAAEGGLYRSDDRGRTWTRLNAERVIQARPWYYNHIFADPGDANTVYIANVPFMRSVDGGRTFAAMKTPHGDHHDHWINPDDPEIMINGNDGGATVSLDGGKTWSTQNNQPTAQFYRVATDDLFPYNVYGGQQDNTAKVIASATRVAGIGRRYWHAIGGGESAHVAFNPADPRLIYATSINGTLTEYDSRTGIVRSIRPYPEYVFGRDAKDHKYRTNWNAPVALSPHDPSVLYYGTQVLLRTNDRGQTWREISPDLTRNEKTKQGKNGGPITNEEAGAEFYNTLFYIVESPHEAGVIWTGSDDGLVHLTRDGGKTWADVTPKGVGEAQINAIEVSPDDPASAYIAVAGYKMNDFRPHIYKTENYGKSWRAITRGLAKNTFVRVVREDPAQPGLLYAGTEAGMYVSFNDGRDWQSLRLNLPPVPITDLSVRQGDLVAATQGRGFWILDGLSPLQQIAAGLKADKTALLAPEDAYRLGRGDGFADDAEGKNPPDGVVIYYYLNKERGDDAAPISLDILDNGGALLRHFSSREQPREVCARDNTEPRNRKPLKTLAGKKGLNRWVWDLRRAGLDCIPDLRLFAGWQGARVVPGVFRVRLTVDGRTMEQPARVLADPRYAIDAGQFAELDSFLDTVTAQMNDLVAEVATLRAIRGRTAELIRLSAGTAHAAALKKAGGSLIGKLTTWEEEVVQPKHFTFDDDINWPNMFDVQTLFLLRSTDGSDAPVQAGARQRLADLQARWRDLKGRIAGLRKQALTDFNARLAGWGIGAIYVGGNSTRGTK